MRELTADPTPEHERRVNKLRANVPVTPTQAPWLGAIEVLRDYVDRLAVVLDEEIHTVANS